MLSIGGIVPLSTIDYPNLLSLVVFCQGCPLRCLYCHNKALQNNIKQPEFLWYDLLKLLQRKKNIVDAVVISGGEPLLQNDLDIAIKEIKRMGFKIGIHTSGYDSEKMNKILPMVNWVGLDIKTMPEMYKEITGSINAGFNAWKTLEYILDSGISHEIRHTLYTKFISAKTLDLIIEKLINVGVNNKNIVIQKCSREIDWIYNNIIDDDYKEIFEKYNIIIR